MNDASKQPPQKKKRSGSAKRQRQSLIGVRVYDHERARIEANAAAVDLCPSAFLRAAGTGSQRPSERRRPAPDTQALAQLMAQVGRIGGNLAQFLKLANRGDFIPANDLDAAVQEARAFIAEAQKAIRG